MGNASAPRPPLLASVAFSFSLLVLSVPCLGAHLRTNQESAPIAREVGVEHPPRLDGTLDDPLWQSTIPVTDFRQQELLEGQLATEKTEVRILYTHHAVYFGIHYFDSNP